eukprot:59568_3
MEIIDYAKYLGMNPIFDADLLWVAAEGLTAPLPAGWTEHEDQDGNLYFYNVDTDHSTREQSTGQALPSDLPKEAQKG